MSSSLFDGYDEEYLSLSQEISKNISNVDTYETDAGRSFEPLSLVTDHPPSADAKAAALTQTKRLIDQANQLVGNPFASPTS
jgi:hypothetical protein